LAAAGGDLISGVEGNAAHETTAAIKTAMRYSPRTPHHCGRHDGRVTFEQLELRSLMSGVPHGAMAEPPKGPELPQAELAKPAELKGTVTADGVALSWQDKSDNETGFGVFKLDVAKKAMVFLGQVDANVTTFTDASPASGLNQYVVRALKGDARSTGSNVAAVNVAALTAPNKLTAVSTSTTSIKLTWAGDKGAVGGYVIQRSTDGTNFEQIATTGEHTYTDTGLKLGVKYYYKIVAVGVGDAAKSTTALVGQTSPELPQDVLAKPTDLKAAASVDGVVLNWKDKSNNETGFGIFKLDVLSKTLIKVGEVDANVTTYTDTSAPLGTTQYVVRALKGDGRSAGSNVASVTLATLTAPNKLRSAAVSTKSIKIGWEGDQGAVGGFVIERSLDGVNFEQITTTKEHSFTDTGLDAGTRYYYRITVVGLSGDTKTSAVLIGQTKKTDGPEPVKK
jgi:fibronectin type 3 domain-containing protein